MNIQYIFCATVCGWNSKLAGLHENKHRTKSGNTATQGERKHGRRRRETRDTYIQVTPRARLPNTPTLERGTLSRQFIHQVRGSAALARASHFQPGQRIDHDSGSLFGQWPVGGQWALTQWQMWLWRTAAECSRSRPGSYISSLE